MHSKLIVILGPTASGKSTLAIKLAHKFNGEIISADSRQVYKGMDIGTGKISRAEKKLIKHHLLDVVTPNSQFTVSDFKKLARLAIKSIQIIHKLPFVVGGTAFYIYSLIDDWNLPNIKPNAKLRRDLSKKSADELFAQLKILDPARAANIDRFNKVRLIRALEIIKTTGMAVSRFSKTSREDVLFLGIQKEQKKLYKLIDKRLEERLASGMIEEIKKLRRSGVSWKRLTDFGLEYRFIPLFLQGHLTYLEMVEQLKQAIHKFSKRQMTWFKNDKRIHWIKNKKEAEKLVRQYLKT